MKKLLVTLLLLVSVLSFSQENKKDPNKNVDRNVTQRMDSLSKVYKVKVIGAYKITHNGVYVEGIVYEDKSGNVHDKETKRIKIN
jgi:hypothetical protein